MFNIVIIIILHETLVGLQLGYQSPLQNIGGFKVFVSVRDRNTYNMYFFSHLLSVSSQPRPLELMQAHPITGSP